MGILQARASRRLWVVAGFAWAASIGAQPVQASGFDKSAHAAHLSIALTGHIKSDCRLTGGAGLDLGQLVGNDVAFATFGLDCNVPFDIDVTSGRGALTHQTLPRGQGPFAGSLDYDLTLSIPVISPKPADIQARFWGRDLVSTRSVSSGDAIAAGGGRLELRTRAIPDAGLLAGDYSETVTLTLAPRL